jgi:hypothetical protein
VHIVPARVDQNKSGFGTDRSAELIVYKRSTTPAIACPWPMHIVAIP